MRTLLLLSFCLLALAANGLAASFPAGFVPFSSIYYVSQPDANGNRLVEGYQTLAAYQAMRNLIMPSASRQQFSDTPIQLAPGQFFANVYIPSAAEISGDFSADLPSVVYDPLNHLPFAGNFIPAVLLGEVFAFITGPAAPALSFLPVTPCRIADTRLSTGPFGGPFLSANTARSLVIPLSACNIPSTASAYSLNVTVVPHGPLGYLTVWPTGQAQPLVSTLNSDGRVKANAAITPAGVGGAVSFYATNDTDLIVDINGYFVLASSGTGLSFYPLTPCRISDTRNVTSPFGGPSLIGGQSRDIPIQQSNCGVPSSAQAYSLNFTAVPLNALGLGYLSTWASGQAQPLVSTLNASNAQVTANAAIVPAGSNGDATVYASDNTNVIVDVNGYFAPPGPGGLSLYSVAPCRPLDTRFTGADQPFDGTLYVLLSGSCEIPSNASAVVLNATVVPQSPLGFLALWSYGLAKPLVSTLNAGDGVVTSNLAIVPTETGAINAYAPSLTHLVLDVSGYFAP